MHFAAEKGQTEVACLLLQQKGIDYNQLTIFFLDFFNYVQFLWFNHVSFFKKLITFTYQFNYAPLHLAAEKGHFDIVQLLLQQPNIEINIKTICGNTFMKFSLFYALIKFHKKFKWNLYYFIVNNG